MQGKRSQEWLKELNRIAVEDYGFKVPPAPMDQDNACWLEYFNEGRSPCEALSEDASYGA